MFREKEPICTYAFSSLLAASLIQRGEKWGPQLEGRPHSLTYLAVAGAVRGCSSPKVSWNAGCPLLNRSEPAFPSVGTSNTGTGGQHSWRVSCPWDEKEGFFLSQGWQSRLVVVIHLARCVQLVHFLPHPNQTCLKSKTTLTSLKEKYLQCEALGF